MKFNNMKTTMLGKACKEIDWMTASAQELIQTRDAVKAEFNSNDWSELCNADIGNKSPLWKLYTLYVNVLKGMNSAINRAIISLGDYDYPIAE